MRTGRRILGLIMTITATYRLGYAQYRHDGVGAPETGETDVRLPPPTEAN